MSTADNIITYYKQYCEGYNDAKQASYDAYRLTLQPGERCQNYSTWRLRSDERAAFSQAYGNLRNKAQGELEKLRSRRRRERAQVPPAEVTAALEALKGIPINEETLNGFAETYGNKYYLVRSTLQKLARDNKIYGVQYTTDSDEHFEQDFEQLSQFIDRNFAFGSLEARATGNSDSYNPGFAWQVQEFCSELDV